MRSIMHNKTGEKSIIDTWSSGKVKSVTQQGLFWSLKHFSGSVHDKPKSSWVFGDMHLKGKKNINVDGLGFLIAPDTRSLLTWTKMQMPFEQNKEIDYEVSFLGTSSRLWVINGGGSLICFCLDLG